MSKLRYTQTATTIGGLTMSHTSKAVRVVPEDGHKDVESKMSQRSHKMDNIPKAAPTLNDMSELPLKELEKMVTEGEEKSFQGNLALYYIIKFKKYKEKGFKTQDEYLKKIWGITRKTANRRFHHAEFFLVLSADAKYTGMIPPSCINHVTLLREVGSLEKQLRVWTKIISDKSGQYPEAKEIKAYVESYKAAHSSKIVEGHKPDYPKREVKFKAYHQVYHKELTTLVNDFKKSINTMKSTQAGGYFDVVQKELFDMETRLEVISGQFATVIDNIEYREKDEAKRRVK